MPRKFDVPNKTAQSADYRALAEFRYHIRRYLEFSDQAAKAAGLEPRQYQLLLAIRGLPDDVDPTVGVLAQQLHAHHHSTVELINRAESNDLVRRLRAGTRVFVRLTKKGERVLARIVDKRLQQLRVAGPALVKSLQQLINTNPKSKRREERKRTGSRTSRKQRR
jgi:DNA-binding MarR family transcriptional regulator